ncbi:MAG: ROK family protein [Bacteroidota bacterium]
MGIIGVDIGGTNLRVGFVEHNSLERIESMSVKKNGKEDEIIQDLISLIKRFKNERIEGIGIGVPSVVDSEKGVVYDVTNIPSWKEVHLKEILEAKFDIPVYVNNDANCFVVGEKYFGRVKKYKNIVGLIIGTGLGSGLIINDHLYAGKNYGAGEFGMIPYKDRNYEYYCSGRFFISEYGLTGEEVFSLAVRGEEKALNIFDQFGNHLGDTIKMILFAIDPEVIVLGGSISKSYNFFENSMWDSINKFAYSHSLDTLKIMVSELNHSAILGAAALYYESRK